MWFKKKMKIIEKRHCITCKTEEDLQKSTYRIDNDGNKVQYFICRTCNNIKHMKWYNNGNQKKAQIYNRRYKSRKMGL